MVGGLVLAGLALLVWLLVASMDWEDPWLEAPERVAVAGPKESFTLKIGDRGSGLKDLRVTMSQDGQDKVVLTRAFPPGGEKGTTVEIPVTLEPKALGLKEGKATLTVSATDRSWQNFFRGRGARLTREVEIDLVPLSVAFVGVSHLLTPGGAGFLTYRVSKVPKESGVRLGDRFFPGYPLAKGPKGEYGVFFAVPLDAAGKIRAAIVARGVVGGEAKQDVALTLRPKKWRHDRMNLSETFLRHVGALFPEADRGDLLQTFLEVNRKIRQANHARVRQVCAQSQPQPLWAGAFVRFPGKAMARFGDRRTYVFQNRVVDEQVHQGEDLASFVNSVVPAGNHGVAVLAEPLGIYGNTVILDHGQGVFSMYSHLKSMDVKVGDRVEKGKSLGRTGATGLAGGDHLHFGIAIHGEFVNPVEWWDPHWLKDQVDKVGGQPAALAAPPAKTKAAPQKARGGKAKQRR